MMRHQVSDTNAIMCIQLAQSVSQHVITAAAAAEASQSRIQNFISPYWCYSKIDRAVMQQDPMVLSKTSETLHYAACFKCARSCSQWLSCTAKLLIHKK